MDGDPLQYFRIEGRELLDGLVRGILDLEKGLGDPDLVARLLRHAHTLKGAARVVRQAGIAEASHTLEGILAGVRDRPDAITSDQVRRMLQMTDAVGTALALLDQPAPATATGEATQAGEASEEPMEAIRVRMQDLDALLSAASDLRVQASGLRRQADDLHRAARTADALPHGDGSGLGNSLKGIHRGVTSLLERVQRQVDDLNEQAQALRLVPADSVFPTLQRTALDAAEATGRRILFEATGGDTRLDAHGLRLLGNALIHLVRNAVAHGIEPPARRAALGKPAEGRVQIRVERRQDRAIFTCSDDGCGVDLDRVRQAAVRRGLVAPVEAANLSPDAMLSLLLRGGVTTARTVSQISGRGVGLDVVRESMAALRGSVVARSETGQGTRIELSVPVLVESQLVLHLEAGDRLVSIPLESVRQTLRLAAGEVAESPEGPTVSCDGRAVRFAPLHRLLDAPLRPPTAAWSVLIVRSGEDLAALGVDHVRGLDRVVIRSLPANLGTVSWLRGAFLDGDGNPQLVLDPDDLVRTLRSAPSGGREPVPPSRAPLLVIDDSLTTRMLEQGILEAAGYDVDTASSGEEALEKARRRRYGAFIVDVEMPGMDGFQFLEAAAGRPESSGVPAIVVTSRDSVEDRARGARAGARAYIAKGAFDEVLLLRTILDLVG